MGDQRRTKTLAGAIAFAIFFSVSGHAYAQAESYSVGGYSLSDKSAPSGCQRRNNRTFREYFNENGGASYFRGRSSEDEFFARVKPSIDVFAQSTAWQTRAVDFNTVIETLADLFEVDGVYFETFVCRQPDGTQVYVMAFPTDLDESRWERFAITSIDTNCSYQLPDFERAFGPPRGASIPESERMQPAREASKSAMKARLYNYMLETFRKQKDLDSLVAYEDRLKPFFQVYGRDGRNLAGLVSRSATFFRNSSNPSQIAIFYPVFEYNATCLRRVVDESVWQNAPELQRKIASQSGR